MADGPATGEIRIGVSSCLLGHRVRFDGGHKRDELVAGLLPPFATFVPVCPEVEVGMGTPRPPIRLVRIGGEVRLVEPGEGADHTRAMRAWAGRRLAELEREGLSGFILKRDSPSCGLERVEVWSARSGEVPARDGTGLFAEALRARWPDLPVVEEERLRDPAQRRAFVERVLAHWRLRRPPAGR